MWYLWNSYFLQMKGIYCHFATINVRNMKENQVLGGCVEMIETSCNHWHCYTLHI